MATATASVMEPMSRSLDLVIELIWQHAMAHLKHTKNEILLPADINTVIGQDNVEKIKDRLSALLSTPVVAFKDDVNSVYRIMPTPVLDGAVDSAVAQVMPMIATNSDQNASPSPKANKAAQGKPEKIPRPPNAFILYRQHHHPLVKASHPGFHNNEISVLLGKRWKAESAETKAHFKSLADEIKVQHAKDHPDYQYAPRKPSEKKRRSTSRRDAHHLALNDTQIVSSAQFGAGEAGTPMSQSDGTYVNSLSPASDENNIVNDERNFDLIVPLSPGRGFTNMTMNHSTNYVMGFEDAGFMNFQIRRLGTTVTTPQHTQAHATSTTGLAGHWSNLDFEFDNYFAGLGQ
ncbi:HMG domain-containing protein, variant 4 [Blastomyces dermatitidis ER-3]|uniref:HMG domain-containing protein n=2 Tax=Blastomyces TaxID=229219 RepID=A0A179USV5_BLAGS|nr:HMG domain-containing protein [Blastomyces gilchristii SLH14081]XP_031579540.1 HMG domain-containing protein, variant 1 [Blastomyces gilchristii SLH14081]XP_031579541.1 HMG domain-containing protein, variant 2 [Blastomyces gilchristii SLH14081]XP_031579542.1 HMG domain-containing protein, variant 3 [Blastomyces gilchristii SLH14081]XP_031579543.1 HMG domain-containing protein, variant 4 [Blastomyces gilchristii SLH14081]XP_045281480.1 HMG domain-containing protein [Blastomyces dermatitidis 